jgi:hypothetical protein
MLIYIPFPGSSLRYERMYWAHESAMKALADSGAVFYFGFAGAGR